MGDRYSTVNLPEDQYEPGSNGKVLRNLLGITSKEALEHLEEKRFELLMEESAARFDVDHRFTVLWLHRFWLQGIFSWAGAFRSVNIGKGGFMFAAAAHVPPFRKETGELRGCCRF